ncbi:glucosamine-6-phosphate deaminase [Jeotgalibacillus haloalkalitolerans]|uniref:Glucosamine-6-phosphate deaminase n=1 Tax=Jeotgalibacillus haloalkalitolerans TaxID=3104292 RepID=A0ABU5KHJ8_9BACL|nr:glucosamine-6-phosphate deaminase [Jeotgalibacillus sp. HH7-29]MDZ5710691.1 glucosamine-6-phosphate deaminase [Jeotgalibacillus sp. HH7-29]
MKLMLTKDYDELSKCGADLIMAQINAKQDSVLGLATGSSPLGCYQELIQRCQNNLVTFKYVSSLNLDEYIGLSPEHQQSYRYFMNHHFFNQININQNHTYLPNGVHPNLEQACIEYETKIDQVGPPDIQILGIGANGHIGFNEPGSSFSSYTHIVKLAHSTRQANARFFRSIDEVPTHAITMGISSILKSKKIILMASGQQKAEAIKRLLDGEKNEQFPASSLFDHPDVTLIVDKEAYELVETENLARC